METDLHCQIIGGGIAGLATALCCQQEALGYTLWEKEPRIDYRRVGLGISRNIFPLLENWGLLKGCLALGAEIKKFSFVNAKLQSLRSLHLKAPALSVDRQKFTKLLYQALNHEHVRLNASKTLQEFKPEHALIVAEGINSPTRALLHPHIKPRSSHQLLWRGMAELDLPPAFHNAYHDFIGGNLRFAIIHSGGNCYSWYAVEESPETPTPEINPKQYLLDRFHNYHPHVHDCITATEKVYAEALKDIDPAKRKGLPWHSNNLVFIGDAIHATTPNMANGACLAMEDAWVLVMLLKAYPTNFNKAFASFQALREGKINAIVRQSWLLGKMMHQQNPLLDKLNLAATRLMPQWAFDKLYAQVLNNDSLLKAQRLAKRHASA